MTPFDCGRVLILDDSRNENLQIFISLLTDREIDVVIENDIGAAIPRVQAEKFDVIILDANITGMAVERTIKILKNIDPNLKIIVKTEKNSKELESKVRKEAIYYYHLNSFGWDDLGLAVESAIRQNKMSRKCVAENSENQRLVLIVDEDDAFIEIHKTNLEQHLFKVIVCFDAKVAIENVQKLKPDLIIVDIDVQVGSDGRHFLEMVMDENEEIVRIPMLVYVSKESYGRYVKILDRVRKSLPAFAIFEKPVKIEDVIPQVEKLLNQKNHTMAH
jgi:DNA-binding NtrC family response regulator